MAEPVEVNHQTQADVDDIIAVQTAANVTVIPEGGGLFTVQIRFEDTTPAPANPGWAATKRVGDKDFHSVFGGQEWRFDNTGIFLHGDDTPARTRGAPVTCSTIVSVYGREILKASLAHDVPPELIVMTIAVESAADLGSKFTGAPTFRWEPRVPVDDVVPPTVGDYSAGPMQTLATTAREVFRKNHPGEDAFKVAPAFATRPVPPPSENPLYGGELNIDLGTAEIKSRVAKSGFDPILVAACYNSGGLTASDENAWHLVTTGDHLNRASQWFGDACAVLEPLRQGMALDANSIKTPKVKVPLDKPVEPSSFELSHLTKATADVEVEFYKDSGATVELIDDGGGLFTVRVRFAPHAGPVVPGALGDTTKPDLNGFVFVINRIRTEKRNPQGFRTIGLYQGYFDREKIPEINGMTVEQHGPGDNTGSGVAHHSRIAAGLYPLFTHSGGLGPSGLVKYKTFGFSAATHGAARPWPSIRVENTRNRGGILIHCASGFMMSIGCINLGSHLQDASSNLDFSDSRSRVIALINSMKARLGGEFPTGNNKKIENTTLQIIGEP